MTDIWVGPPNGHGSMDRWVAGLLWVQAGERKGK